MGLLPCNQETASAAAVGVKVLSEHHCSHLQLLQVSMR